MSKRLVISAVVAGGLALGTGHPARAERPRVAVVGVAGDTASPELRDRMARAITDGLVASGADVVTAPGGSIVYRVRGTLELEGRTYILRLEMIDGETGAVVEGREDRCEICTESEALETAGVAASALKAQVFKRRPAVAVATTVTVPPAPPPTASAPGPAAQISSPPPEETPPSYRHRYRSFGVAGIATGAVAAAAGGFLLSLHHQYTGMCTTGVDRMIGCTDRWNTAAGGAALMAGGALTLTLGILAVAGVF
jgi:hypothetical protein